jgi:hypothetical protein
MKVLIFLSTNFPAALRRCFECRSRGDLGTCKDPFRYNSTQVEEVHGARTVPCASGWCGKVIEGQGSYRDDGEFQDCIKYCNFCTFLLEFQTSIWPPNECAFNADPPTLRIDAPTRSTTTKRCSCVFVKVICAMAAPG